MFKIRLPFLCENRGFLLACDDILALQAKKFAYVIGRQSHRRFYRKRCGSGGQNGAAHRQGHHSYMVTADTYGHVLAELGRERTDTKIWKFQKLQKVMKKSSFSYEKLLLLAAEEGFEPSQTESESVVLPLHNSAIFCVACLATLLVYNGNSGSSSVFFRKIKKL